jgi:multidrug efflux system outer membrane protein
MKPTHLPVLIATLLCGSCTVGPNYQRPKTLVETSWSEADARATTQPSATTSRPIQITQWWATFRDPQLDSLVARAVRGNLYLKQAESRIRQARAQRVVAGAAEYPTIDAGGGYFIGRGGRNIEIPQGAFGAPSTPGKGGGKQEPSRLDQSAQLNATPLARTPTAGLGASAVPLSPFGGGGLPGVVSQLYQVGFDASWEIDVFGGTRREIEAAEADLAASTEDRRDVLITLLAEVARNYVELRGFQRELAIAQENLESLRSTLRLTRDRFNAGVTTQLDVARAAAQVSTTEASIPAIDAQVHQAVHRLSVLLGEQPGALSAELLRAKPIPAPPPEVPVGLPSDLLRRRPDVRRAERQIAAATARVGVATAELFPKFTLTGTLGFDATKLTHIADWSSRFYSLGPGVSWPIFTAGRIRANIRVQNEAEQQALIGYHQTVLVALRDVEDALVVYSREQQRRKSLSDAVAAERQAVDLANQQYAQGVVDFLTVLETQRSLYGAEDALVQSDERISANLVALYKALGGGWEIERAQGS